MWLSRASVRVSVVASVGHGSVQWSVSPAGVATWRCVCAPACSASRLLDGADGRLHHRGAMSREDVRSDERKHDRVRGAVSAAHPGRQATGQSDRPAGVKWPV